MAWKKYFRDANLSPISGEKVPNFAKRNYSSYLPDVYTGHPNRIQRYFQYDQMDSDSEINAALDILAEFSTQKNTENETPFDLVFKDETTEHEVKLLKKALQQWTKSNKFNKRIFRIFRNALKYGDCFFVRDPETHKWLYIDNAKVDRIVVNESEGKKPEQYVIRDINPNLQRLSATQITPNQTYGGGGTTGGGTAAYGSSYANAGATNNMSGFAGGMSGGRFYKTMNAYNINAEHVIHMSMSDGLDNLFPFGQSVLEQVFKVYKQKELLETIGMFDPSLPACEDYDLWLRITAKHKVSFIAEKLTIKYGGHADQLSKAHWGMDRFRIIALTNLLNSGQLSQQQYAETTATLVKKSNILLKGARKHGDASHVAKLEQWLISLNIDTTILQKITALSCR